MCYKPVQIKNPAGKPSKILVSCRQCLECRQTRANEWALLCTKELELHKNSMFLTLTYEKSPVQLQKKDLQLFIKRLRKSIEPLKIKYFACGEYGRLRFRPHYHIIIFGYMFDDIYSLGKSNSGKEMFGSDKLSKLWSFGITTVQGVTKNTIAYSALYSSPSKKHLPKHLQSAPEFNIMSQSLGVKVILRDIENYLKTDEIYVEGFAHNIPTKILKKYFLVSELKTSSVLGGLKITDIKPLYHKKYYELKEKRLIKYKHVSEKQLIHYGSEIAKLEQKQFVAENKQKRLTNTF